MTLFARWNSTNDGIVRVGLRPEGSFGPGWTFSIDGRDVTAKQAVARLRQMPVMDWVFNAGIPPSWSLENRAKLAQIVLEVYRSLGGFTRLSKASRRGIRHVLDSEIYTQAIDTTKPRLDEASGMPFCATFAHIFGECLRAAGFTGPAANYAMAHGPTCPAVGGPPFYRITPYHCPGAMDGATTFLVGYITADGKAKPDGTPVDPATPYGCLKPEEVIDAIHETTWRSFRPDQWQGEVWLCVSGDYQPGLDRILSVAVRNRVDMVLLWFDTDRRTADPAWGRAQDEMLEKYINAAIAAVTGMRK